MTKDNPQRKTLTLADWRIITSTFALLVFLAGVADGINMHLPFVGVLMGAVGALIISAIYYLFADWLTDPSSPDDGSSPDPHMS